MPIDPGRAFTLILEPVMGCNLRCRYCYADTSAAVIMSRQTLQSALAKTIRYAERQGFREMHLLWHGGEPLLAGLEFYKTAIQMLTQLSPDLTCRNFIQTNGLLLDQDFCAFFRDHEFQIGVSLDGPPQLHDSIRVGPGGQGSHTRVVEKLALLAEHGVPAGINAVVSRPSLGQEMRIYRYFQRLGKSFRLNPMIPGSNKLISAPFLLGPGEYGRFLRRIFRVWAATDSSRVAVSPLDLYIEAILTGTPSQCQQQQTCSGSHLAVKPGGEVVLCSRFATHVFGNINDLEIEELLTSDFCIAIRRRAETLSDCHGCPFWSFCHGGCPHNALVFGKTYMDKDPFCLNYQLVYTELRRTLADP